MHYLTFLVCLVLGINFVKCEINIAVTLHEIEKDCTVPIMHKVTVGDSVYLKTTNNLRNGNNELILIDNSSLLITREYGTTRKHLDKGNHTLLFQSVTQNDTGQWMFIFEYMGHVRFQYQKTIMTVCKTFVYVDEPAFVSVTGTFITFMAVGGVLLAIVIIAEAIAIVHFKNKAKTSQHSLLLGKPSTSEDVPDRDRYCTNPIQKAKKMSCPRIDQNRESEIYEVPDIVIGASQRPDPVGASPKIPPSPSSTLRSNKSPFPTFPRPTPTDQDTLTKRSIANRPPLALPTEEVYEEARDDCVYEPPPVPELPSRLPPHKAIGKQLPNIPMEALKPRGPTSIKNNKPPIAQTRPNPTLWQNESKPVLARFAEKKPTPPPNPEPKPTPPRKVFQLPVQPIPGPSSLKKPVPKSKPPVPVPKSPPPAVAPSLEQQVKFFNDNRPPLQDPPESWDGEEWTYEPLYNI